MEQSRIWDHFQGDAEGQQSFKYALPRYRYLADRLHGSRHVLNIGVGCGGLESLLLQGGIEVSCLDPSERAISSVRARLSLPADKARVGLAQAMPFPTASFDRVVMSEVLEHLDGDVLQATLCEVRRVLQPGGQFLGTVPADEKLLDSQVVCPDCGKVFHRWGHVQSFDSDRLRSLLAEQFDDVRIARTVFGPLESLNWKGRLGWLVKRCAVSLGLKGSGENLFFTACRA